MVSLVKAISLNVTYQVRRLFHISFFLRETFLLWLAELITSIASIFVETKLKYPEILSQILLKVENVIEKSMGYSFPFELGVKLNYQQHTSNKESIQKVIDEFIIRQEENHVKLTGMGFRIVDGTLTSAFGHMSHGLELLKMAKELNFFGDDKLLILQQRSANAYYLDHWAPYFVSLPMRDRDATLLSHKFGRYVLGMDWIPIQSRPGLWGFELYNFVKNCHQEKFGEVASLEPRAESKRVLEMWLAGLGYEPDNWHVVFHVREKKERNGRDYSNADVRTFLDSIDYVIERGGLAILIGENNNYPLPEKYGFINYARRNEKSEKLNIAILSLCRFLIGTSSGPLTVPPTFGIPILYTNNPRVSLSFKNKGFCITKKIKDTDTGKILKFNQQANFDLGIGLASYKGRYTYINNSSAEILDATREMFELNEGKIFQNTGSEQPLNFRKNLGMGMEFAPSYLKRNENLL